MSESAANRFDITIERRFVRAGGRSVHYRCAGSGPEVVMLHDSPRSSRLYIETMKVLATRFRVHALDTPGYGNSDPIGVADPTIADFADALGDALSALGLVGAPLYATHTSAKIALDYAARRDAPGTLILDGISIPAVPTSEAFIADYMRPFRLDDGGAYLAAEWSRIRDMLRWFPWFRPSAATRMAMAQPPREWIEQYAIDLFSAGPHYSDAYAAAMRYDPAPALRRISHPTIVAARADDVLVRFLDNVPTSDNRNLSVVRLAADRDAWLDWLTRTFEAVSDEATIAAPLAQSQSGPVYIDLPHGQMLVHRTGESKGPPLLILEAPGIHNARRWQQAIGTRHCLIPELPGHGDSDAFDRPEADGHADALAAMLDTLGKARADILAIGFAAPLALAFAARHPDRISRIVLDGAPEPQPDWRERYCPAFEFDSSGAHLHRIWHMLRDGEANWPWFDGSTDTQRAVEPGLSATNLHRSLLGILKQPNHYGDATRAAIDAPAPPAAAIAAPLMIFDLPADPAYRAAEALRARYPNAITTPRPPVLDAAAAVVRTFLNGNPPMAHPHSTAPAESASS